MKLLHVTDLRSEMNYFQWIARVAPHFDLICLSVDLLDMWGRESLLQKQIAEINSVLDSVKTPLAIGSGNHDTIHAEADMNGKLWVRDLRCDQVWADGGRFQHFSGNSDPKWCFVVSGRGSSAGS